jgi:hypothetical protein
MVQYSKFISYIVLLCNSMPLTNALAYYLVEQIAQKLRFNGV